MRDLVRRRVDFDFDPAVVPRNWYRDDAHLTTFWNALSLLFPEGERFFVESVRRYRDRIDDPGLLADIDAFIGQRPCTGAATERSTRCCAPAAWAPCPRTPSEG